MAANVGIHTSMSETKSRSKNKSLGSGIIWESDGMDEGYVRGEYYGGRRDAVYDNEGVVDWDDNRAARARQKALDARRRIERRREREDLQSRLADPFDEIDSPDHRPRRRRSSKTHSSLLNR